MPVPAISRCPHSVTSALPRDRPGPPPHLAHPGAGHPILRQGGVWARPRSRAPETDVPPIRMWSMLESTLDVRTAAVSGVLVATTALSVFVMDRVAGPARRLT